MKRGIIKRKATKQRKATKRSKEGAAALAEFKKQWIGKACWNCETFKATDVHHIVKGRGKVYDDKRNFFAACRLCRSRIEGDTIVLYHGIAFDPIPLKTVLRIKQRRDKLDLAFLRELSGNRNFGEGIE